MIFFDQGATIPVTLPRSSIRDSVQQLLTATGIGDFESANDGQHIQAAVEIGRSVTKADGRGLGLSEMRELVDIAPAGSICILSRKGRYLYKKGHQEIVESTDRSIGGTLIHWRFQL